MKRITLRPFTQDDADAVQQLVSAREIAANTLTIPHPYPEGGAALWIASHAELLEKNGDVHWAVVDGQTIVGAIVLLMREHRGAELGYWIGVPYWGRGYATEAVAEVLRYAFEQADRELVYGKHFTRNAGSGQVMLRNGMRHTATLRNEVEKWGERLDVERYELTRDEWLSTRPC